MHWSILTSNILDSKATSHNSIKYQNPSSSFFASFDPSHKIPLTDSSLWTIFLFDFLTPSSFLRSKYIVLNSDFNLDIFATRAMFSPLTRLCGPFHLFDFSPPGSSLWALRRDCVDRGHLLHIHLGHDMVPLFTPSFLYHNNMFLFQLYK